MSIKLKGSSDGSVSLDAPADTSPTGTDVSLTLPTSAGSANQFIKNGSTAGELEHSSMVEDSSGKVGIGTTSPAQTLDIASTAPNIRLTDTVDGHSEIDGNAGSLKFNADKGNEKADSTITFFVDNSEKARIDSGGFMGIGTTSPGTALHIEGNTATSSRVRFTRDGVDGEVGISGNALAFDARGTTGSNGTLQFFAGNTKRGEMLTDGRFVLGNITPSTSVDHSFCAAGRIESDATHSITTSSSANVHISTSGLLSRSTSSRKYKANIETMEDSYADAVLNARPVWFNSTAPEDTEHPEWGYWGFIAEEIHDIDPRLVYYGRPNEEGTLEPEGVQYDRFVPHLVNLVKRQKEQIEALTARIAALEAAS